MGESSSRRTRKRSSKRKERKSKHVTARTPADPTSSPPSYSVEENSQGEWVNGRLNVKWPQQAENYDVSKHRYRTYDYDNTDTSGSSRKKRSENRREGSSKKQKRDRKKKQEPPKDTSSRSPTSAESPYISLSSGPQMEEESSRSSKRVRRERRRMVVQTSPVVTAHSGFLTDDDGKKIDSAVFDTRSEMMRHKKSDDILAPQPRRRSRSKKIQEAADQRENEEYNRYYLGVRSRRSVEAKLGRPGEFALYYEKPREGEVPLYIGLKIAYLSSTSEAYHFPIQCFEGADGVRNYVVMQNKSDGKMFTSVLSLVKHYSLYSHVDTSTGRLETFSIPH